MNTIIIAVSSNMDIAKLNELLKKFDKEKGPLCEIDISAEFKKLYEANDNSDVSIVLQAERMAFDFREDCKNQETGWGTYYGSMFVFRNEDGTFSEGPSIQKITPEIINYWEKRSQQTQHPVLKARYLGLIWDFSEKVSGKKPSHTIALAYIDNLIEIAEKKLQEHEGDIRSKLKRAIELSKSLNRTDRLEKARECVLTYHNSIIRADAPGFWPMAYDLLIENKKAKTTPEQEKVIINQLEEILTKLEKRDKDEKHIDPWKYESVALPLAEYYQRKNKSEDLKRVVKIIGSAFEKASENVEPMLSSSLLQHVHTIYSNFGFKEDTNRIAIKLREVGPEVNKNLDSFSIEQEISQEEINKFVDFFIDKNLDTALNKVVVNFIPHKDKAKEQIMELSKTSPVYFTVKKQIQDHKGRVVAVVGGIHQDLDKHIILQISQNMHIYSFFLRRVYEGIQKKFDVTSDKLIDYIYKSPIFSEDKKEIIKRGVRAYLEGDFLVATHLIVPQIEDAIRNLFELNRTPILIKNKDGGYNLATLGNLLAHPLFEEVFGEDCSLYFRVLFTDSKGWNLRDDLCHGLMMPESFHQQTMDRVIHAVLCLAVIGRKDNYE